jgi:hypothetical protein
MIRRSAWHLFQLAFVLLSLRGIVDPAHGDRTTVDLVFFPTGGGKTEAYLGVIAFTLLRPAHARPSRDPDRGLGVAVLLRYTLRLLTLDQLGRAAGLVCALELLRRENPQRLGDDRFAVGLWVGRSASANRLGEAKKLVEEYRNRMRESPYPLTHCPWCGTELDRQSLTTTAHKTSVADVVCTCPNHNGGCEFSRASKRRDGLPVLFVDEQIYRQLPCFVVGTVDKFAMLPWRGETGMMFGRVHSRSGARFFGPVDAEAPGGAGSEALPGGLLPPELVVQDELHLISGPLGTMVGLYETDDRAPVPAAHPDGGVQRPKIIASTATVRRAHKQIKALYGGRDTKLFPPPGVDAWDTFFAEIDPDAPRRLYVGVAATGAADQAHPHRTYLALLAAAQRAYGTTPPTPRETTPRSRPPTPTPRSWGTSTRCASWAACDAWSKTRSTPASRSTRGGAPRTGWARAPGSRAAPSRMRPWSSPAARARPTSRSTSSGSRCTPTKRGTSTCAWRPT